MVVAEVPLWIIHSNDATNASSQQQASLQLLESIGAGGKAPLYSLDLHQDLLATGGGDGKVRLWKTTEMFAKHRGTIADNGDYASSSNCSTSSSTSSSGDETTKTTTSKTNTAASSMNVMESGHDITHLVRRKKNISITTLTASVLDYEPATTTETTTETGEEMSTVPLSPAPILPQPPSNNSNTNNQQQQKLLCTLSAHTGSSVLCVRFSPSGKYLASAGDDAVVCIYMPDNIGQHWSRIKVCRGHTLDVVDLAWAPDDSHLVSCSLDKDAPIIVWKLNDLAQQKHVITQSNVLVHPYKILGKDSHISTVKGVTFDPAGTYLASSGDDSAVCIWRAHDDWGLEQKVHVGTADLSSQTLFRRLSWSTDGTYICSTNATMNNKHVASTISRNGWTCHTGSAHLVGHKQPVVVSRHLTRLLQVKVNGKEETDDPDYATLVALGDKQGFITVWSTKKSRPLFKLQCSESKCTVTDLAWGYIGTSVILMVSLLDGYAVALSFSEKELGPLLSDIDQKRVFHLRYGIEDDTGGLGGRRLLVGETSGPKLIENALQFTLEEGDSNDVAMSDQEEAPIPPQPKLNTKQVESKKDGKKRIRPVLVSVHDDTPKKPSTNGSLEGAKKKSKCKVETVKEAIEIATKAATAAEDIHTTAQAMSTEPNGTAPSQEATATHPIRQPQALTSSTFPVAQIPHSTSRVHTIDLPILTATASNASVQSCTAECCNSTRIPKGSSGQPLPCTTLSISLQGRVMWKDDIIGTSCSAIAAGKSILAVGTIDGTLYLYGNSPTLGWKCSNSFRSHPPLILGQPIVSLDIHDMNGSVRILIVSADGSFGVYTMLPDIRVEYKGSIFPAMTHMLLSANMNKNRNTPLPKLSRIQLTGSNRLLMLLSLERSTPQGDDGIQSSIRRVTTTSSSGPGGSLQAFVYNNFAELWMRVADGRFILSDFYSILPSMKATDRELGKLDDAVRSGVVASSIQPSRRGRDDHAPGMYHHLKEAGAGTCSMTRSHCEDRLACAVALGSAGEFSFWLARYVRTLVQGGFEENIRLVVDLLIGSASSENGSACWWLSSAPTILSLDRHMLVQMFVIPEMSKNRAFQRLTNEISLEVRTRLIR